MSHRFVPKDPSIVEQDPAFLDFLLAYGPFAVVALALPGGVLAALYLGGTTGLGLLSLAILLVCACALGAVAAPKWERGGRMGLMAGTNALHLAGFAGGAALLASLVVDVLAAGQRFGLLRLDDVAGELVPAVAVLTGLCLAFAGGALVLALGAPAPSLRQADRLGARVAAAVAVVGLVLAANISAGSAGSLAGKPLTSLDAVFALNFAAGAALAAALLARRVPTFFRAPAQAGAKAVLYPALAGFAVIVGVLVVFAMTSLGKAGAYDRVLPPVLLLVVAMLAAGTVATVLQSRTSKPPPLFVEKMAPERRRRYLLLGAGAGMALLVAGFALQVGSGKIAAVPPQRALELLLLAPLLGLAPLAVHDHLQERRQIRLEDRVPDLLRDLAASRRAGLTLPKACLAAADGNYDALTPEVKRMASQVSWDLPFEHALDRMADRVGTVGVRSASAVVSEASASGGEVHDVLQVVSEQRREARELHGERRRSMTLYVTVIYVAFFVFVGILVMLDATFLPSMAAAAGSAAGASLPGGSAAIGFQNVDLAEYRKLFLVAAFVQGVGDGLVAGLMTTGRLQSGLKHAVLMGACGVLAFALLLPVR